MNLFQVFLQWLWVHEHARLAVSLHFLSMQSKAEELWPATSYVTGRSQNKPISQLDNLKQRCLPALLFVAFGQSLTEAGVGTQVQRGLTLLVPNGQVRSVSSQEAGNGCCTLLFRPLGA